MNALRKKRSRGFTLVEFLIVLTVLALVVSVGIPSFAGMLSRNKLRSAAEKIDGDLRYARSEAIKRNDEMFISVASGSNWCVGVDDTAACNCQSANDCSVGGVETVTRSTDFAGVSLNHTLTGGATFFEPTRGTASTGGAIMTSAGGRSVQVQVSVVGRVRICSDSVSGYSGC